jgi:hypothetical protein
MQNESTCRVWARIIALLIAGSFMQGLSSCVPPNRSDNIERQERDGTTSDGTACTCEAFCQNENNDCVLVDDCSGDLCYGYRWDCSGSSGVWLCEDESCTDTNGHFIEPEECL